jgi:fructose-specific phosphotransferase system IIC component
MPPERINLRQYESPSVEVQVIDARSRATAVSWGFVALITTVALGLVAYVALDVVKLETNTLREWLQTTVAGEIGLLAGILGSRDRG